MDLHLSAKETNSMRIQGGLEVPCEWAYSWVGVIYILLRKFVSGGLLVTWTVFVVAIVTVANVE